MGNIYVCEDCEKVCDIHEIENEYEVASPYEYSGCRSEYEMIDVSDCCDADYKEVDEDEYEATLALQDADTADTAATEKCGTMVNEPTLMDNLKSILIANSKALLNEGER